MNKKLPSTALAFILCVLKDLALHDPSNRNAYRSSARYLEKRYRCEGDKFISYSLPLLGKACEISLITGERLSVPPGFTKHWRSELPSVLYELFAQVFGNDGIPKWVSNSTIRSVSDEAFAFWAIRQVTLAFSKVEDIPPMVTNEEALKSFSERISQECEITAPSWLLNRARQLIQSVVMDEDRLEASLAQWESYPFGRHGPGAVAMKEKGLDKWNFHRIPGGEPGLFQFRSASQDDNGYIEYGSAAPIGVAQPVSRATCVPKDFRSPRIICIEPKEFQFAQQGLWDVLRRLLERNPLSRRAINFEHQEYNGRLCKRSDIATIDLKDASDRVMLKLCRILFPKEFFKLTTRYRSRMIDVNQSQIRPKCFASMGSALCFPIETLVFWAITQAAIHPNDEHLPMRVFGDDIVVPRGSAPYVIKMLESCGFKVNAQKTCVNSPIRESCGAYTFAGTDVRITRFKTTQCRNLQDWLSYYENGRQLLRNFLPKAGAAILRISNERWPVPYGYNGIPRNQSGTDCQSRWNSDLQRVEVLQPVRAMRTGRGVLAGFSGLYAWLVGNQTKPSAYGTEKVKKQWVVADTSSVGN